jgi:hypothetical protein
MGGKKVVYVIIDGFDYSEDNVLAKAISGYQRYLISLLAISVKD